MKYYRNLRGKYIRFKENLSEAFSAFIYELSTGQSYIEFKEDLARLYEREHALEHPKSADEVKLVSCGSMLFKAINDWERKTGRGWADGYEKA